MPIYIGFNRQSGDKISDDDHLTQSIGDILTTRIGTRVYRPEYGSRVPDLIDHPANGAMRALLYAEVARSLIRWEPRIRLAKIVWQNGDPGSGRFGFVIYGKKDGKAWRGWVAL